MRRRNHLHVISLVLVLVGILVGIGLQGQARVSYGQLPAPSLTSQPVNQAVSAVSNQTALYRSIYSQVNPSVVSIRVRIPAQNLPVDSDSGLPDSNQPYQVAAGSGFVYDDQGHVVTNAHVVQNADVVEVTFSDGNIMRAKISGIDLDSDLAVIQLQGDVSGYKPVPLGDSDTIQVGDVVLAIGNPFEQAGTMTQGIISALNRTVKGLRATSSGAYSIPGALQTDAALNPGNSGGPLLNESGQVIGVNEQIEAPAGQSSGISFAIPVNLVKQVVPALIKDGRIAHPYLGISTMSLNLDLNEALKIPAKTRGALVIGVAVNSPAAQAGLQPASVTSATNANPTGGDIIVAVDKQTVRSSDDLIAYLFAKISVGQSITLTFLRNGMQQNVQVKLAARPQA